ncbi:MAG TPA: site-specific tyrosine recombinase XerD [Acidobacteriota bacterium]|nr:site-specific tyrosine recombinase XerD [Acidobacteriota bacterium]
MKRSRDSIPGAAAGLPAAGERCADTRPLHQWVERFLDNLVLVRGRTANTLQAYRRDLARYDHFCGTRHIRHPRDIDARLVGEFLGHLTTAGLSPASMARSLSSVKSFHRYLLQNEICPHNPARSLRTPRIPRRLPDILSVRQMRKLLAAPPEDDPNGIRDRAILAVLYGCGLRVSEAAHLSLDEVDFESQFVRIRGKGNKERLVPFGRMTHDALTVYLDGPRFTGRRGSECDRVFLSRRGEGLTRMGMWLVVRKAATRVDLTGRVTPHTFRHSFATHLIEAGADLRSVQMMLGHASVSTTQIYTHLDRRHLQDVHARCHPLEAVARQAVAGGKSA